MLRIPRTFLPTLLIAVLLAAAPTPAVAEPSVFRLPEADGVTRVQTDLTGTWELAVYPDPDMDVDTYVPVRELPDASRLDWQERDVPGSLHGSDGPLAHRVIYRTRVDVPASHEGRGFKLHFKGTNWIVSVFVNGELAGEHRGVWIPWDIDISGHVRPGQVNEIAVAVKSPWYGFDTRLADPTGKEGPGTLEAFKDKKTLVRPIIVPYGGKGDGNGNNYGIVNPVALISVGQAYTEDIFVRTSVEKKRCDAEVTVRNTTDRRRTFRVDCTAVNDADGSEAKSFEPVEVAVPAGESRTVTVGGAWEEPDLWWPEPNPHLYRMITTVSSDGRELDVHEQLFGFREVTIDGTAFRLNGLRWNLWGWWGVRQPINEPGDYAAALRKERTRFNRFFSHTALRKFLPAQEDRLEYYDRHGIAGCQGSMIEGMGVRYVLGYVARDANGQWQIKMNEPVWDEFRRHMRQIAKAYRNHPSVLMYSLENETIYINAQNFYGWVRFTGLSKDEYMQPHEEAMASVMRAAQEYDDTKPYVVSGAGDLSGRLPMNTPHYPRGSSSWYPENAYTIDRVSDHVARWPWKKDKPWYVPESTFASDLPLGTVAIGDEAFRSQGDAERGKAVFQRMLFGGYRWAGTTGWSCCGNYSKYPVVMDMLSPLCVIPRKQTSRLYGGRTNELLFKVMNDTFSREPVTLQWIYRAGGRLIAGDQVEMEIEPGFGKEYTVRITPPRVTERLDGELTLRVMQEGADPYEDVRSVPVLPVIASLDVRAPVAVYDRSGRVQEFLDALGVSYDEPASLADAGGGLLIVGPDTLSEAEAYGQDLLAAAMRGARVIVLEQENTVGGGNLPVPVRSTAHYGGYAHPQGLGTPLFRDLGRWDLIDWAGDFPVYKNAFRKPETGARSLVHCGELLRYSALVEVPVGRGFVVLSQLRVGEKLGLDPAADVLLRNLIEHYGATRPSEGIAAVYAPSDDLLAEKVAQTGLRTRRVDSLAGALDPAQVQVAVVDATPDVLRALTGELASRAEAFQQAGGWVMLSGLGPDGVEAFNDLVGGEFLLRPFRVERVTFEGRGEPLGATLGNQDVGLISNESIQHGRMWPSWNTYSTVIDAGRNFAPFTLVPGGPDDPMTYEAVRNDKDPFNFVNNLYNNLSWRCIRQIWWPGETERPDRPLELTFRLRRPETVEQINIHNNANYSTIKDMQIIFDGDEASAVPVVLPAASQTVAVKLDRPRDVRRSITLRATTKRIRSGKNPNLVGIENVQFLRASMPQGATPLDNVGGLVGFPAGEGQGGIFLSQIKFLEEEPNRENAAKKVNLLGVLLSNMGVGAEGVVGVPGVNVRFEPVDLMDAANQYRDARWVSEDVWFGGGHDLGALGGEQDVVLANIAYRLVHFTTAPKQDCVMLGAKDAPKDFPDAVRGIAVGKRADLLFFLQTANVTQPITEEERERMTLRRNPFRLPTVMRYVLHYTDGQHRTIPVVLDKDIAHWLQEEPLPVENAQIAWSHKLNDRRAVLYSMKVPNPRPDVEIESIDIELAEGGSRAVPAVLAITLGQVAGR